MLEKFSVLYGTAVFPSHATLPCPFEKNGLTFALIPSGVRKLELTGNWICIKFLPKSLTSLMLTLPEPDTLGLTATVAKGSIP